MGHTGLTNQHLHARTRLAPTERLAGRPSGTTPNPTPTALDGGSGDDLPLPQYPGHSLVSVLGRGGMGVVYLAYHRHLKRQVALKALTTLDLADPEAARRIRLEAELLARVQHPHIVQVYETGVSLRRPYLTLEYVSGGTLADRLAAGPAAPADAARLMLAVARAVHFAHDQGILHRDLKPGNILLTPEGEPKIADFGLARDLRAGHGLTRAGLIAGTLSYMAPEQLSGSRELGRAADVYALGVILYELLAGRCPSPGTCRSNSSNRSSGRSRCRSAVGGPTCRGTWRRSA